MRTVPLSPSVDPKLIASAVAAAVAEERANAVKEVADRRARTAADETNRLVAEIAGFAPGRALAASADAGPENEADEAGKLAAEIAAFVPNCTRNEAEPATAEDFAAQIASFAPSRRQPEAGTE